MSRERLYQRQRRNISRNKRKQEREAQKQREPKQEATKSAPKRGRGKLFALLAMTAAVSK